MARDFYQKRDRLVFNSTLWYFWE